MDLRDRVEHFGKDIAPIADCFKGLADRWPVDVAGERDSTGHRVWSCNPTLGFSRNEELLLKPLESVPQVTIRFNIT